MVDMGGVGRDVEEAAAGMKRGPATGKARRSP